MKAPVPICFRPLLDSGFKDAWDRDDVNDFYLGIQIKAADKT
jgi:hypothetical protein